MINYFKKKTQMVSSNMIHYLPKENNTNNNLYSDFTEWGDGGFFELGKYGISICKVKAGSGFSLTLWYITVPDSAVELEGANVEQLQLFKQKNSRFTLPVLSAGSVSVFLHYYVCLVSRFSKMLW